MYRHFILLKSVFGFNLSGISRKLSNFLIILLFFVNFPAFAGVIEIDPDKFPTCQNLDLVELLISFQRDGTVNQANLMYSSGCSEYDQAILRIAKRLNQSDIFPVGVKQPESVVIRIDPNSIRAKNKLAKLTICERLGIAYKAYFSEKSENIIYFNGKEITSTFYGASALEKISKFKYVGGTEKLLEKISSDSLFRKEKNIEFPDKNQSEKIWSDFSKIYSWAEKIKSGAACPWGMSENDLEIVFKWMSSDVITNGPARLIPDLVFIKIVNSSGLEDKMISNNSKNNNKIDQEKKELDDKKYREEAQKKADEFAKSPAGIEAILRKNYSQFMAVQDCYEIRSKYVQKYIDPEVYSKVKAAMKALEIDSKKKLPKINTEKVWKEAIEIYNGKYEAPNPIDINDAATIGSIGTERGVSDIDNMERRMDNFLSSLQRFSSVVVPPSTVRKMIVAQRSNPSQYDENLKGACTTMATNILKNLPANEPKKDF